jgi:hypothetical protein
MLKWNRPVILLLALSTAITFAPASAGVNEGFTVTVGGPERLENPEISQRIVIPVRVAGLSQIKGSLVTAHYNPNIISFVSFDAGNLAPGAQPLSGQPVETGNGFVRLEAGSTLLGSDLIQEVEGGILGTFTFEVISEVPETGSAISIVRVEVNTSGLEDGRDVLDFPPGRRGVSLVRTFANPILDVEVIRKFNGAVFVWKTRLPGFNDVARVRLRGSSDTLRQSFNRVNERFNDRTFEALDFIRQQGIDLVQVSDGELVDILRDGLSLPAIFPDSQIRDLIGSLRLLEETLRTRRHIVQMGGLEPLTEYEFELFSLSQDERKSNTFRGFFTTRGAPDLRPLFLSDFDIQAGPSGALLGFSSNRPVTTSYSLVDVATTQEVASGTINEDGEQRTRIELADLIPGTEYEITITGDLLNAADLVESGLSADQATVTISRRFHTRLLARRLRIVRPPVKIVGSDRASIVFELNQPAEATVDYGLLDEEREPAATDCLYTWQQESGGSAKQHHLTLSNLDPSTLVRYKITLVNAEGDTLSTDPRGNFQWSRDLRFRTSAAADTLPPSVILGPVVDVRDVLAVVRFATDVPTAATVFIGTDGGTYKTEDEFEFSDLTSDGGRRFSNRHSIIVAGLDAGENYQYRLEVEATNGQVTTLEPTIGSAKSAGALQPPGGGGSFTTSNDPDTQFPVILSGPTVSSKTHETAIVEWTTDEPADSEVSFGAETLNDEETSGVTETSHKITLSDLSSGTSYSYTVGSTDASGNGATESSTAVFTTDPDVDLTAPQITVSPAIIYKNDETATIQWTTDEDASGEVEFGTDESLGFIRTLPSTDKVHEVTLTNLTSETTYHFQAASTDLSNNGPTTTDILTFTTDAQADVTLPTIGDVSVQAADSTAIFTWTTDELADSFIDFGVISGILDVTVGNVDDVTNHEITLTNLTPGTTYFYTVGSIDRAGNGPTETTQESFSTLSVADTEPPSTPSALVGTAGSEQAVLSWDANSELDLAGYNLYRRLVGEDAFSTIASRLEDTTYTDQGLSNNTEYEYQITAIDRATPSNESASSTTIAVTPTTDAAPTVPTGLSVGAGLEPVFTFSNADPFGIGNSLSYTIQVSTQEDFSDVTASESDVTEGSGATSWTITRELTEGVTYYWRVRAVEGALTGPFTDAENFIAEALPELPGDFDDSGSVDFDDFFAFIDNFGKPYAESSAYDVDGSGGGIIDFDDFFAFIDNFGRSAAGKSWGFAHRLDDQAQIWLEAQASLMGAQVGSQSRSSGVDERIRVRVWIDDATKLSAFGLVLGYDPSLLQFESAQEGAGHLLESQGGHTDLFSVLHQRPGVLLLGNGLTAGDPVDGKGLLAELSFRLMDRRRANEAAIALREAFVANGAEDVRRVMSLQGTGLQPASFALSQAYPNPFNPTTQIEFALAQDTPARLVIYDVLGQRVRTLVRGDDGLGAGFYTVTWDGTNAHGASVGNGLYFYRLETPDFQRTGKMMMIK